MAKTKSQGNRATESGQKFEEEFAKFLHDICNLTVLNKKDEFVKHGVRDLYETLRKIRHPPGWDDDILAKSGKRGSETDGIILEFGLPFEHKGGNTAGSTTEKIWWEWKKLEAGINPNRFLYVFAGRAENEFHARKFTREINKMRESGDKNFTHVYCVNESELTTKWLDARFERVRNVTLLD